MKKNRSRQELSEAIGRIFKQLEARHDERSTRDHHRREPPRNNLTGAEVMRLIICGDDEQPNGDGGTKTNRQQNKNEG